MNNQYKLVNASNINDAEIQCYLGQIEKENKVLFDFITANLQREPNSSIREDVLKYISDNIEFFPKGKSAVNNLYGFLSNIYITPKHWEIIFEWLLEKSDEDIKDFVIVFNCAVEKEMPLEAIKKFFSEETNDFMDLYERVVEYEPSEESYVTDEIDEIDEMKKDDNEIVIDLPEFNENDDKSSALERVAIQVSSERKEQDNGYISMLNQFVNILSLKNRNPQSIYEAQDHMSKLFAQIQLIITETSACFTEIAREWENDKADIERVNSFCEIQRNLIMQLQNKINTLQNENKSLKEQLFAAEMTLNKSEEINKKAKELIEITSSVSTPVRKPNYPYFNQ